MAVYEYRCRTCAERFEVRRPMHEADAAAACPVGHPDTVRLLSVFAATGIAPRREPAASGGCCGGACGCGR